MALRRVGMGEYDPVSTRSDTKASFDSYRRRLEAARDEDLTEDDVAAILLDHAPEPGEVAENDADGGGE